jgi:uncharacterized protein
VSLARTLLLAAIRGYRRHVSPHKGFACAYRVHAGGCSCSTLGLRAVSRYGAWRGLGVLRLRLEQCRRVAQELRARPFATRSGQAGFVDCDVPCDASCVDGSACSFGDACEVAACLDCGDIDDCGWPWWNRSANRPVRRRRRGDPPSVNVTSSGD